MMSDIFLLNRPGPKQAILVHAPSLICLKGVGVIGVVEFVPESGSWIFINWRLTSRVPFESTAKDSVPFSDSLDKTST